MFLINSSVPIFINNLYLNWFTGVVCYNNFRYDRIPDTTNIRKDLRLVGYSYYSRIEFNVVVGIKGDSMDRYLVRMNESLESVKTLNKCIRTLTTWYLSYTEVYGHVLTNMESMIHYFKLVTEGYTFTLGQTYLRQESPKGELGCYIVHGQTTHPCRVSIRTPELP